MEATGAQPPTSPTTEPSWAPLQMLGSGIVAAGGIAFIISLFLHYVGTVSLWDVTTRLPLILTIVAAVAVTLALAALTWDAPGLLLGQAILGAYLFGQAFPVGIPSYDAFEVGFWIESVSALAMAVGGALAVVGNWRLLRARGRVQ